MAEVFRDDMTLGAARDRLRHLADEGERCPLCTQFAKVYRRSIYGTQAHDLIACYREHGAEEFFHLASVPGVRNKGDFAKLAHWGLVEKMSGEREDGSRRVGWWKITRLGERFIRGEAAVPSHARIYDERLLELVEDHWVRIEDVLGKGFDYRELMEGL